MCAHIYNALASGIQRKSLTCGWLKNGLRLKMRNQSIQHQKRGHLFIENMSLSAFYWQIPFMGLRHFRETLSSAWKKKFTQKAENNNVEDHILSLCISIKEIDLVDLWLPFQMTNLINGAHWSSFHIMALTTGLKPTIWNQYFWAFSPLEAMMWIVATSQRGPGGMKRPPSWFRLGVHCWQQYPV